jgi:hypothetical protein
MSKTDPNIASNSAEIIAGPIGEIGERIKQFSGIGASDIVMQGSDEVLVAADPVKAALWVKDAIDRLDILIDEKTREQIMTACGRKCQSVNKKVTEEMKARRREAASEEEFLATVLEPKPGTGARYERDGDTLIHYYTPRKYRKGLRCYCGLMRSLPEDINASPTYCQCSRSFVQVHWEVILGRPVKVELGATALTGSRECKFIIHL